MLVSFSSHCIIDIGASIPVNKEKRFGVAISSNMFMYAHLNGDDLCMIWNNSPSPYLPVL